MRDLTGRKMEVASAASNFYKCNLRSASLSRLISREKLRLDPAPDAVTLHLHPVPFPVCNFEPRAFGGGPKNTSVRRGCRSDIYARTL